MFLETLRRLDALTQLCGAVPVSVCAAVLAAPLVLQHEADLEPELDQLDQAHPRPSKPSESGRDQAPLPPFKPSEPGLDQQDQAHTPSSEPSEPGLKQSDPSLSPPLRPSEVGLEEADSAGSPQSGPLPGEAEAGQQAQQAEQEPAAASRRSRARRKAALRADPAKPPDVILLERWGNAKEARRLPEQLRSKAAEQPGAAGAASAGQESAEATPQQEKAGPSAEGSSDGDEEGSEDADTLTGAEYSMDEASELSDEDADPELESSPHAVQAGRAERLPPIADVGLYYYHARLCGAEVSFQSTSCVHCTACMCSDLLPCCADGLRRGGSALHKPVCCLQQLQSRWAFPYVSAVGSVTAYPVTWHVYQSLSPGQVLK